MDEQRLSDLEALCQKATAGPWIDLMTVYFERCLADKKEHGNRWYHGSQRASSPLVLIAQGNYHGEPIDPLDIPRRVDKFDLHPVISLFWSSLPKRTTLACEGFMTPEDSAFIAESRTALPEALTEIRHLHQALGGIQVALLSCLQASGDRSCDHLNDALKIATATVGGGSRPILARQRDNGA